MSKPKAAPKPHGSKSASRTGQRPRQAAEIRPAERVAGIVLACVTLQVLGWALLYYLMNVLRVWPSLLGPFGDIPHYHEVAAAIAAGRMAYRDFFLEYPPLIIPLLTLANGALGAAAYYWRFVLEMIGFSMLAAAFTALAVDEPPRTTRRPFEAAALFALGFVATGTIAGQRYDMAVAAVLALAMLLMAHGRWEWSAAALGIGFALKITPALLLPLVLVLVPGRRRLFASAAAFVVPAVVPFVPFLLAGPGSIAGLKTFLGTQSGRPLEFESVLGTPLMLLHQMGLLTVKIGSEAGGQTIISSGAGAIASLSFVLVAALIGGVCYLAFRRRDVVRENPRLIFLAVLATVLGSIVFSKVLSPQYLIWILPAVAIVALDRRLPGVLLLAAMLLTQVFFPAFYSAYWKLQTVAVLLLAARNLLLVAALALIVRHLWQATAFKAASGSGKTPLRSA